MGVTIGVNAEKSGNNNHLVVVIRMRLLQNIDLKSESIQKRKRLYNTYEKCDQLLGNVLNATYTVYLPLVYQCQPSGSVSFSPRGGCRVDLVPPL